MVQGMVPIDPPSDNLYSPEAMGLERAADRLVLVVDDDPDILQTLALCLSTEGYKVLMAANGQEALEVLAHERPNCVLLDLMMPVMDGWQFVSEIESRGWRRMPLLILSADRAVQQHSVKLRAEAYLAKPFDLDELLGKVSSLIGGPSGHNNARPP
jgi:two-component system chemotaxis response regulator CheY